MQDSGHGFPANSFLAITLANRFRRRYLRAKAETTNRDVGVALFRHAVMHEAKLRHPDFFFHRDQDRRVFADDDGGPLKGQGCLLVRSIRYITLSGHACSKGNGFRFSSNHPALSFV
jgi:hypothetical protein